MDLCAYASAQVCQSLPRSCTSSSFCTKLGTAGLSLLAAQAMLQSGLQPAPQLLQRVCPDAPDKMVCLVLSKMRVDNQKLELACMLVS